jgi:hypothetical protein
LELETQRSERLGTVTLEPSGSVIAGHVGQWTLRLTVGSYGIDEGGTIKVAQRFASDWESPQFDHPSEQGFTSVSTTGEAKLAPRFDRKGHIRPLMRCMVIDVYDGSLSPGDVVEIVFGDQSHGSPGIRAQSFQESAHEFRVLVDPTNACLVQEVPNSPVFPVVAGPAVSLVSFLPSDGCVGESPEIFVSGRDQWGNPAPANGEPRWIGDADVAVVRGGRLVLMARGCGQIEIDYSGHTYVSNPIRIHDTAPSRKHFWGDLHAQTDATVGTGTEEEYFLFGRDEARLDFTSHQGNDFQMTDEDWHRLNEVTRRFHEDGRFVVFPGYEWSANTPAGGDRNVFYRSEGKPIFRSSHWQVLGTPEDDLTPAHPADEFFRRVREHVDLNDVIVASHVGGRYADIRKYMDEELAPLVEVVSCWGVFEWMLWDAFDKNYRVGVMCNSDGHKGRPGDEGPGAGEFGIASGLTCVLAPELTRDHVFDSLKSRHCYGTTGARILLDFAVDGAPMGSDVTASGPVEVHVSAVGTTGLECVELFAGRETIRQVQPDDFDACGDSTRIRVMWGGSRIRGRGRRAVWDGSIRVIGNQIVAAKTISFDSPADGINKTTSETIEFRSRTTGDCDGIEIELQSADQGTLRLETPIGELEVDLAKLKTESIRREFGGLDLRAWVQRYPQHVGEVTNRATFDFEWDGDGLVSPTQVTPLFVKVTQTDGHMAWSSPVYVTR